MLDRDWGCSYESGVGVDSAEQRSSALWKVLGVEVSESSVSAQSVGVRTTGVGAVVDGGMVDGAVSVVEAPEVLAADLSG